MKVSCDCLLHMLSFADLKSLVKCQRLNKEIHQRIHQKNELSRTFRYSEILHLTRKKSHFLFYVLENKSQNVNMDTFLSDACEFVDTRFFCELEKIVLKRVEDWTLPLQVVRKIIKHENKNVLCYCIEKYPEILKMVEKIMVEPVILGNIKKVNFLVQHLPPFSEDHIIRCLNKSLVVNDLELLKILLNKKTATTALVESICCSCVNRRNRNALKWVITNFIDKIENSFSVLKRTCHLLDFKTLEFVLKTKNLDPAMDDNYLLKSILSFYEKDSVKFLNTYNTVRNSGGLDYASKYYVFNNRQEDLSEYFGIADPSSNENELIKFACKYGKHRSVENLLKDSRVLDKFDEQGNFLKNLVLDCLDVPVTEEEYDEQQEIYHDGTFGFFVSDEGYPINDKIKGIVPLFLKQPKLCQQLKKIDNTRVREILFNCFAAE